MEEDSEEDEEDEENEEDEEDEQEREKDERMRRMRMRGQNNIINLAFWLAALAGRIFEFFRSVGLKK